MRVVLASDHAGFDLKKAIVTSVQALGYPALDLNPGPPDPEDDYPDSAQALADAILGGQAARGVLICGSGVGACVAANKVRGIRAGLCHDTYSAHQGVEHDDMNVIVMGSRVIGAELAKELVKTFLGAEFSGGARHVRRLAKIRQMEERFGSSPIA